MKIEDKYQATTLKYYNFIILVFPCNKALKNEMNVRLYSKNILIVPQSSQLAFTCLMSIEKARELGVKYVQS